MTASKDFDMEQSRISSLNRLSKSLSLRRTSIVMKVESVAWLNKFFRNYKPACWGMEIIALITLLFQTSLMVLCTTQPLQVVLTGVITLAAIAIQREAWPFRRSSE